MKHVIIFFICFVVINLNLNSKIANSHHDFSGSSWANYEICIVCHTPHNANLSVTAAPLWNHQLTSSTFQTYTSVTLNATVGQPNQSSKLCLSCHDGTVAMDNYGTITSGTDYMSSGRWNLGTDLTHQHPISFDYNTDLANADGELYDPSTRTSGLGGTVDQDLLFNGKLECASCHDVHVGRNNSGCTGCHTMHPLRTVSLTLRKSNSGSALCLTCHRK